MSLFIELKRRNVIRVASGYVVLTKEVNVEREGSIVRFTGKKLDRIIMVILALGLGYFAFDKFVLDPRWDAELVEVTVQQTRSDALVNSVEDRSIAVS